MSSYTLPVNNDKNNLKGHIQLHILIKFYLLNCLQSNVIK